MIYVSTGGLKNSTGLSTSKYFASNKINAVELSGGLPDMCQLKSLKKLNSYIKFQIHNYFPPPHTPFVFNLASLNSYIGNRSYKHVETAMQWALELSTPVYSFHAGFLIDPAVNELGNRVASKELFDRNQAMVLFLERVCALAKRADQLGVSLLIENNVLSFNNYIEFKGNPFLMATADECKYVMDNTPYNVNLLIDVAHLKVSAKTLDFNPTEFLEKCEPWIQAYHLSDNDGSKDSNEKISRNSWFWPYIKRGLDYYSLEIYNASLQELLQQVQLTEKSLGQTNGKH